MTALLMNSLADYEVGDVLILTKQYGGINKSYNVEVTAVDFNNNGLVTYSGNESGQGAFDPATVGVKTRYQYIVSVKKIGHNPATAYRPPWSGMSHRDAQRYYGVG